MPGSADRVIGGVEDAIVFVERIRSRLVTRAGELTRRKRNTSDGLHAHILSDIAACLNAECIEARTLLDVARKAAR